MNGSDDQEGSLPALPPELQDQLFAVLFGEVDARARAFAALLAAHPRHAEALRAHLRQHEQMERGGSGALSFGDESTIPGYRLLRVLGEGGMGTVYHAEQVGPIRRQVAVKVIKPGMDSKAVLARFEQERQSLALMDHDAIARVYGCGATGQGLPYFAMELVEGLPLVRYCDQHRLSVRARLGLFQQVCEGVQHAHQKGVIHRDLKPGNVLVASQGNRHVVKIIDFGVARAIDRRLGFAGMTTEQGLLLGTPEYMSPEQAAGDVRRIDTRTDIYSLGVILYELLVGVLPFTPAELRQAGLAEVQRKLREDEPPKPSSRWSTLGGVATTHAAMRRVGVEALRRELAGDLDWVVLKAMAKEPERRYASATALAEDLGRYLGQQPLQAGPPSLGYRLRKYLRRHRGAAAAVTAVLLTAVVGGVVSFRFALAEQRKVGEFEMMTGVVHHQRAVSAEQELYPAWPGSIPAIERWLREDCGRLERLRTEIAGTLVSMRERALPGTAADLEQDRRTHPRAAQLQRLGERVAAQRRAMAVRDQPAAFVEPRLPAEEVARLSLVDLRNLATERISPLPAQRTVAGEEPMGLAYARLMERRTADKVAHYAFLEQLAWALFANGLDAEAVQQAQAAIVAAPVAVRGDYEDILAELRAAIAAAAANLAADEAAFTQLQAEVAARRTWHFASEPEEFLYGSLVELLQRIDQLLGDTHRRVSRRLEWARRIGEVSRAHPNAHHSWAEARAAIAASPLYRGRTIALRDEDVVGLVPLGPNPVTGLWEFYDLRSAADDDRDPAALPIPLHRPADGGIDVGPDTGIVFVLLPGGDTWMGAQKRDAALPNYDKEAPDSETVLAVSLEPFFLARHEVTMGQWRRLWTWDDDLREPSVNTIGARVAGRLMRATHPVEYVSWTMCDTLARRHGMRLPTEAQWEYACRAGSQGAHCCKPEELALYANLADQVHAAAYGGTGQVPWDDGWAGKAPVGTYRPNAFGLYDMHGNVFEWCQDYAGGYFAQRRSGDGLLLCGPKSARAHRGGGYLGTPKDARSASYRQDAPETRLPGKGLRLARALHP